MHECFSLLIDAASNTVALKTAFPHYKKSGRPATLYHPLISRNSPLPARGGCFVRGIRTEKGAMTMSGNVRIELWDEAAGERVCMVDVPVKAPHELAPDEVGREGMEMEVVETEDGGETVEVIMQEEGETASPSPSPPTTSTEPQPLAPLFYVLLTLSVDRVFNLKLYRLHPHQDLRRPQDWESGAEVSVNIDPWIGPTCWAREEAGEVWGVEVAEQIESGARGIVKEE
ncbi:hypothetical protein DFS34DRAFT_637868 [Phlyctochytrium arcticum]|nr:hypothetical protein DFS34DRAFT_637868 [Phlyctochytrium arcticum]